MKVGYCRVSTTHQDAGFEAQIRDLTAADCDKIFSEQVSAVSGQRDQLALALDFVREGDTFVVTKLDRLARSMRDLMSIVDRIAAKKASLRILDINMDTGNYMGKFALHLFGAVAELEREMMLERQREGIARAKAEGKYKGRKPTAKAQAVHVHGLAAEGMKPTAIAKQLGIGRSSVYRILESNGAAQ